MDAHATRVVVWGVPAAVERGAPLRFKIGIKCAAECSAAARRVTVRDEAGRELAFASASSAPWPDTQALHYAEIEVVAPEADGRHVWEAAVEDAAPSAPNATAHAAAAVFFQVRVVATPECVLRVIALDAVSRAPVSGARVVMHPYGALTDARGVAELRVPKGDFRVFVSARDFRLFRADGEVRGDMTLHVELAADRGPSDAELWS